MAAPPQENFWQPYIPYNFIHMLTYNNTNILPIAELESHCMGERDMASNLWGTFNHSFSRLWELEGEEHGRQEWAIDC